MAEPTLTAATVAAAISSATLALLGVDYYSLLYGFVGALWALSEARKAQGRNRAIASVVLSTIIGAAIGNVAVLLLHERSRAALIMGSLLGGAGAQVVVRAAVRGAERRVRRLFGGDDA